MTTSDQSVTVQQANRYVLCFQYSDASSTDYLDQVNDPQYQQEVQFRCERSYESMSILHVSFFSRGLGEKYLRAKGWVFKHDRAVPVSEFLYKANFPSYLTT